MKKIYIFILALIPLTSIAQDFEYSVGQTAEMELAANTYTPADIFVKTADDSGVTFEWTLIENTLPVGWDYSLCDYMGCYPGVPESGVMVTISDDQMAEGTQGFFKLSINPFEIYGEGHVILYVYDQDNEDIGDTVTFFVNFENNVGIQESQASISIYPNPANDFVVINNQGGTVTNYTIQNLNGQVIASNTITAKSKATIGLGDIPAGIYFVTILTADGQKTVKKLIVN